MKDWPSSKGNRRIFLPKWVIVVLLEEVHPVYADLEALVSRRKTYSAPIEEKQETDQVKEHRLSVPTVGTVEQDMDMR